MNNKEMPIPEGRENQMAEAGAGMVVRIAENDVAVMEVFLNDEVPSVELLKKGLRRAVLSGQLVAAFCGTAFKNKGVQILLNAIVDYLPSPVDIWEVHGTNPDTDQPDSREVGDEVPFSALAFKIMNDHYVGNLIYFRVYSGVATSGAVG